ncbi:MAG: TnpV protein [Ruminococcaceae bacterium]|nr:TnpV protein [Oscillospiraceae bacterium]
MKSLFEQIGGTYREENGYLIPNLTLPEEEQVEIGVWGQRHLEYIKNHRKGFYTALILDCKVNRYLADINKQAEEMFDALIKQFKQTEDITEQLKEENQFEWVAQMNNIRQRVTEIVNEELIFN